MAARGSYREYCLEFKGHQCTVCGATEGIVVHHLDGDRENNDLENLIPVCRKHHAQIHYDTDDVRQYTEQLPEDMVHGVGDRGGRKTVSVTSESFSALEQSKRGDESWSEYFWRLASLAEEVDDSPSGDDAEPEGLDEFAEEIADLTAERLGERLLGQ